MTYETTLPYLGLVIYINATLVCWISVGEARQDIEDCNSTDSTADTGLYNLPLRITLRYGKAMEMMMKPQVEMNGR